MKRLILLMILASLLAGAGCSKADFTKVFTKDKIQELHPEAYRVEPNPHNSHQYFVFYPDKIVLVKTNTPNSRVRSTVDPRDEETSFYLQDSE